MALPEWSQSGPNQYNYAVNGIPFLAATNQDMPYQRGTAQVRKEQIDTTSEVGEQSLQNWWYRSQASFDLGAGLKFFDVVKDESNARRFFDSHGVDAISEEGETTLLRRCNTVRIATEDSQIAVGFANAGEQGVLYAYGNQIFKTINSGVSFTSVNWGGSGTILDLISNGNVYFVLSTDGIYGGALPSANGQRLYRFSATRGKLTWGKERLFAAVGETIFALAPGAQPLYTISSMSGNGTEVTYNFNNIHGWEVGQVVTVAGSNIGGYNVNNAVIKSVATNGLSFTVTSSATGTNSSTTATASSLGTPVYTSRIPGWVWSGITDSPSGVYFSGYAGNRSQVFYSTLERDGLNLEAPSTVAEMPTGEVVYSIITHTGTYLIIGTNLGVRIALMASDGTIILGPLINTNNNVKALAVRGNFIWAGGANSDGKVGLFKINLAKAIQNNVIQAPFQKDLYAETVNFDANKEVTTITSVGTTNRIAFGIKGVGLVIESPTAYVNSGWIETGKIRMDTAEEKVYQYLKVTNLTSIGNIAVYWRDETNALSEDPLYSWNTNEIRAVNMDGSDAEPHPWISYRFILSGGGAYTPTLLSYQVKAVPSFVKQRLIQLHLLCFSAETPIIGGKTIERPVFDRVKNLEEAEEKGSVVVYQDLNTGERRLCLIDDLKFVSSNIGQSRAAQASSGGIIIITLRTVDYPQMQE